MKLLSSVLFCLMSCVLALAANSALSSQELTSRQKHIIAIAAYTGRGDLNQLQPALNAALDSGLTINEIREVLVHSYAYCGFPRSLRGLQTFISVLDKRKSRGIADAPGQDASPTKDKRSRYDRGCAILAKISGIPVNAPKAAYAEFAPVMERFLKEHLFADIFERDVLTYDERELATVSILAAIGGVEPMARSHMGICLNLGITPAQLHQLLDIVSRNIGPGEADAVRKELNTLLQAKGLPVVRRTGQDAGKPLVVYFSATGNTKAVAEQIAKLTGADLYRIEAAEAYNADPYRDSDRVKKEAYENLRPKVANLPEAYQMAKRCNVKRVMAEAVKWGAKGARINSISPGIIVTPLAIDEFNGPRGDFYRNMFAKCPAGRPGTADEIAHVAELLMGGKGAFITGADFLIDGGATASYFYGPLKLHDSKEKTSQTIENGRQSTK